MRPFFLAADAGRVGQRLCVLHEPVGSPSALVVHLHAFAEEMNKSRRMVALQSRALAQRGVAVLTIDLLGCGDSGGEFSDAGWDAWLTDADLAVHWMQSRWQAPLWLWGLRAGCLLAAAAARRHTHSHLLLWQPPAAGKAVLQSFLRLKIAGQLTSGDAGGKRLTESLRQQLAAGDAVDVAGYRLPAAVAQGLEAASLDPGTGTGRRALWLEVASRETPELLPASTPAVARLKAQGWIVQTRAVRGPSFWQTTEIEDAPELVSASCELLGHGH